MLLVHRLEFGITSIDRWHSHGSHCPMCHDNLPPKLLRLFFEPKQEAAKASAVASIESGILTGQTESSTANAKDDQHPQRASCDPEIIRLRRELASMTKVLTVETVHSR